MENNDNRIQVNTDKKQIPKPGKEEHGHVPPSLPKKPPGNK